MSLRGSFIKINLSIFIGKSIGISEHLRAETLYAFSQSGQGTFYVYQHSEITSSFQGPRTDKNRAGPVCFNN